ncbi:MAG: tail fiber domain-containing protein [Bacteroidia bacterium]
MKHVITSCNLLFAAFAFAQNVGIGTTTPVSKLSVGANSQFQVDSVGNIKKLNNIPYSFPTLQGTYGQVLTNNGGGGLFWSPTSITSWGLTGNSGTNATTNFIGTIDSVPFGIKVNNARAGLIDLNYQSTFIGLRAGNFTTTGYMNTATGYKALYSNISGNQNTANGAYALFSYTTGINNTATGYNALGSLGSGNTNTAIGVYALYLSNYADNNTATGYSALFSNTNGSDNTANGYQALASNTTGVYNTAVGESALSSNTVGYNNTALGYGTNVTSNSLSNATIIGYNASGTSSNQMRFGNSSITSIGGQVGWTTLSDARVKKNIQSNVPGLAFILKLNPVTYNIDVTTLDKLLRPDGFKNTPTQEELDAKTAKSKIIYSGFIAQEVEATAKNVGYDFSGVDAPKNDKDLYGIRYAEFVVPLVKAMQEMNDKVSLLEQKVAQLEQQNKNLQSKLDLIK